MVALRSGLSEFRPELSGPLFSKTLAPIWCFMRLIFRTAAIIGLVSFGLASGASASTITITITLANGSASCSLSDFTIGGSSASACEGAYAGNDSNSKLDGIFGIDGWTEIAKVNIPERGFGPFTSGSLTVNGAGKSGAWGVTGWKDNSPVMAVLKGGPTFAAYLLNDLSYTSGTWNTDGIFRGSNKSGPALSHLTFYAGGPTPTPIPLPAAGWLLLASLCGLAGMKRRKAAKT